MRPTLYALYVLTLFFQGLQLQEVTGQTGTSGSPQFFDAKYNIRKNSFVHSDDGLYIIQKNSPIRIVKMNGDSIFFAFREIKTKPSSSQEIVEKVENPNKTYYFLISDGEDKLRFTDFDISPLVIPIKIRSARLDNPVQFTGDVSVGPYFGYQTGSKFFDGINQPTQTAWTICVFASPSMINLNPGNQKNNNDAANSVLGITAGSGILFDIKNLQFGLTAGWDWISGTASETWLYQGKGWTSFSFAYNLSNQ